MSGSGFAGFRRMGAWFLTVFLLMNGLVSSAEAKDKTFVAMQCSTTRVMLTCTKFVGGACFASKLTIKTKAGIRNVLPKEAIPQNFYIPTIVEDATCVKGKHKFALYVDYSTPGCQYAGCEESRAYDLNGNDILSIDNNQDADDYFGKDTHDVELLSSIDLEGNQ